MTRRRRPPFSELDYAPAPVLELVAEELEARAAELEAPYRPELPPREPIPLEALELAWSLESTRAIMEPFLARSIGLAGGFRPILERAGLRMR